MSTLEPTTDKLIVQRGTDLFTTTVEDMSTIQDDDLVLIGRGSDSYKITGKEFKEQAGGGTVQAPSLGGIQLVGSGPGFSGETYTTNLINYNPGVPAAVQKLKAKVTGSFDTYGETSPITDVVSVNYSNTASLDLTNPQLMFDGDTTTRGIIPGDLNLALTTEPVTINSSVRVYTNALATSTINLTCNGQIWTSVGSGSFGWLTLTKGSTAPVVPGLLMESTAAGSQIGAIEVDGVILTDGVATLTLTDRKDLDNGVFQPGDTVKVDVSGATLDDPADTPPANLLDLTAGNTDTVRDWTLFVADQSVEFDFSGTYLTFDAASPVTFKYTSETDKTVQFKFGRASSSTLTLSGDVNNPGTQTVTGNTSGSPSFHDIQLQQGTGTFTISMDLQTYLYGRSVFGSSEAIKVVGINQSSPEMTVSGGSWSIGETVKNTVARPPLITPETDEITGYGTPDATMPVYSNGTLDSETDNFPGTMVPGLCDVFFAKSESANIMDYLNITNYTGNNSNIRLFTAATPDAAPADWTNIYGTTSTEVANWGTEVANRKTGEYILVMSCADSNTRFSEVGLCTVPGSPTLTFASNNGLANFSPADDVVQDSGYTPETSEVTSIGGGGSYPSTWYTDGTAVIDPTYPGNTWDRAFNGTQTGLGDGTYGTSLPLTFTFAQPMVGEWVFDVYLGAGVNAGTLDLFRLDDYVIDGDDSNWVTFGESQFGRFSWTGTVNKITLPNSSMYLNKVTFNNAFLIVGNAPAGTAPTVLTLTDDKDLENFRVGDVVQGANGLYVYSGASDLKAANIFPNDASVFNAGWSMNSVGIHTTAETNNFNYRVYTSTDGVNFSFYGSYTNSEVAGVITVGSYVAFQINTVDTSPPVDGTNYFTITAINSTGSTGALPDQAAVAAIGPGNELTVSGGAWSIGDTVTGPYIDPASGVVASTEGSTMSLSSSTGRWITNAGKTVIGPEGPATLVTAYLKWENNNVTELVSVDPGFLPAPPNNQLTFTDPAPTGGTWDEELPAGTYIATKFEADNGVDRVESDWSNSITPRSQALSADPQEAFAERALRLLTFENRKHVYCGQQAEAKRDASITYLVEAGYNLDEILKYL